MRRDNDELEARLVQCERELEAIYHIDRIRDRAMNINSFLMQVADVLVEAVNADLCLVGLVEEETAKVVLKTVSDRSGVLADVDHDAIQGMLEHAVSLKELSLLPTGKAFSAQGLAQFCAVPLAIDSLRLGAFLLANRNGPFSANDVALIKAVVSQTDSAVVHLATLERAQDRARQLEAIYHVDRIRDQASSAQEILTAVVNMATDTLGAELCLMSLVGEESGHSELKAVEDRYGVFSKLDRNAIEQTIEWASGQQGVVALKDRSPLARWGLKYLLGAPLVVAGEQLGALILASERQAFGRSEKELLEAIVSQTDSAVVHARAEHRLRQRHQELETLYQVDRIRDQGLGFDEMLTAVLNELCAVIDAEMGFIMLFDREGKQLELKASTADNILSGTGHYSLLEWAANQALATAKLYAAENLSEWLESIMCVPLILRDRVIGVFGAVNHRGSGSFSGEDKRLLMAITSQVDTAIFESLDKQRIREMFQRYVGPTVMEQMLATPEKDFLKGERARLTALFSDMRGFTNTSERVRVDVLVEMLNMHLGAMTEIVLSYNGTLDKFVADEVVAIFGAPIFMPDHPLRALETALEMQATQQKLIEQWRKRGYDLPPIGIGINTGDMIVGNIGCEQQMDYTVIGDAVNLASRLCDAAAANQILITQSTYDLVKENVLAERLPLIRVQGKEDPVQVYEVVGLK
jgi:adenylate cyclase